MPNVYGRAAAPRTRSRSAGPRNLDQAIVQFRRINAASKRTDKAAVKRGAAYLRLNRAARSAGASVDPGSSEIWGVYERTLDKFLADGKLSRKEKRALDKLAKELRKGQEATSEASADAIAYAQGQTPQASEDRGLAIAGAITAAAGMVGGATATAYGQPQLGAAIQAAGQAVGVSLSGSQVSTAEGQQQAAIAVGQAATALDYDAAAGKPSAAKTGASNTGLYLGIGAAVLGVLGAGAALSGRRGQDGGHRAY